jgi:hypothetical protein
MAPTRPLLERLLNAPDLAAIVPHLPSDILHRVIDRCGLEACAEVIALATPAQLAEVLDADLWRAAAPGGDDAFDAERFGVWLEVLIQSGSAAAVEKIVNLDIEVVVAGLVRHVRVFDHAAVAPFMTLDGVRIEGRAFDGTVAEIGGYVIEARRDTAWDAVMELLVVLGETHPQYFRRLMDECVRLSSGPREGDGFHQLLDEFEQDGFDLASDRETRREKRGYVTPADGRAFLQAARLVRLDNDSLPLNPLAHALLRAREKHPEPEAAALEPPAEADTTAGVVEVLRDAGVLAPPQPLALLGTTADERSTRLAFVRAHLETHVESAETLVFLANALISGCGVQGSPLTPEQATQAAVATCNLGLENWPNQWSDRDLLTAFEVGWALLHTLSLSVSEQVIKIVEALECRDRDIQLRLAGLARELRRGASDGAPWRAHDALDVFVMLDSASWAGLTALIAECPVMHAAIAADRQCHRIHPSDYEFISENSQIATVEAFIRSLPTRLTL